MKTITFNVKNILTGILFLVFTTFLNAQTNVTSYDQNSLNRQGSNSNFIGVDSGNSNAGTNNNFFGAFSGNKNLFGSHNSFFGTASGYENLDGHQNSFFWKL